MTVTEGLILFFIEAACSQISDNKMVRPPGSAGFGVNASVGSRGQCKLSVCVYAGRPRLCLLCRGGAGAAVVGVLASGYSYWL